MSSHSYPNSYYISAAFCRKCGSRYVEIQEWQDNSTVIFYCRTCGNNEAVKGFTLGRCRTTKKEIQNARDTIPKKGKFER